MNKILIRIVQILMILAPIATFLWLLNQYLVPSGVFTVRHGVNDLSPFIERILPDDRVGAPYREEDGDWAQSIYGDPAYFFVHPHRHFDSVDVEVRFKNTETPILEIGALAQEAGQVYDLRPMQNLLIDRSDWDRTEQGGLVLLQREKTFESIDAFLQNTPPRYDIATYHYDLAEPYRIAGYAPSSSARTVDVSLRGFHEFYTYIKDETLAFDIAYMDMNRTPGGDPVTVVAIDENGRTVADVRAMDDGDETNDAIGSAMEHLILSVPSLPEGVYKIQLQAERDIFFRSIATTQQKMAFLNNVYLGDEVGYNDETRPVSFWTQAKHLAFQTQHADGAQEVQVGGDTVRIAEPYDRVTSGVTAEGVVKVVAPRGDLLIETDGLMAFAPDQFFNPDPIRLRPDTDLDLLDVDYIIASYVPPEADGEWLVARVSFDTSVFAAQDDGTWKFVLSAPGISDRQERYDVGSVNMTFSREPLTWAKLVAEIKERL